VCAGVRGAHDGHDLIYLNVNELTIRPVQLYPTLGPDPAQRVSSRFCKNAIAGHRLLGGQHQRDGTQRKDSYYDLPHDIPRLRWRSVSSPCWP
jgi:hypothetical protein